MLVGSFVSCDSISFYLVIVFWFDCFKILFTDYRRDGNCRRLVSLIEDLLREMKVRPIYEDASQPPCNFCCLILSWSSASSTSKVGEDNGNAINDSLLK